MVGLRLPNVPEIKLKHSPARASIKRLLPTDCLPKRMNWGMGKSTIPSLSCTRTLTSPSTFRSSDFAPTDDMLLHCRQRRSAEGGAIQKLLSKHAAHLPRVLDGKRSTSKEKSLRGKWRKRQIATQLKTKKWQTATNAERTSFLRSSKCSSRDDGKLTLQVKSMLARVLAKQLWQNNQLSQLCQPNALGVSLTESSLRSLLACCVVV